MINFSGFSSNMKEMNDPGIKLFGKKIALPGIGNIPATAGQDFGVIPLHQIGSRTCLEDDRMNEIEERGGQEAEKYHLYEQTESRLQDKGHKVAQPITKESKVSPELNENLKTPSFVEETATKKPRKAENDQSDTTDPQLKTMKKPDKILPCPRCNSKDTKFCYYNNYNVNQPRYFCKSCQRYWTSGGTMRNANRKSKNSDSHCRPITISEALHAAQIEDPNAIRQNNETVLSFGSDTPLWESMPCVLNLAEKEVPDSTLNGFYKLEQRVSVSCKGGEYGDDCSNGSSITTSNSNMEGRQTGVNEPKVLNVHAFPSQLPFLPGVPSPCP